MLNGKCVGIGDGKWSLNAIDNGLEYHEKRSGYFLTVRSRKWTKKMVLFKIILAEVREMNELEKKGTLTIKNWE